MWRSEENFPLGCHLRTSLVLEDMARTVSLTGRKNFNTRSRVVWDILWRKTPAIEGTNQKSRSVLLPRRSKNVERQTSRYRHFATWSSTFPYSEIRGDNAAAEKRAQFIQTSHPATRWASERNGPLHHEKCHRTAKKLRTDPNFESEIFCITCTKHFPTVWRLGKRTMDSGTENYPLRGSPQ